MLEQTTPQPSPDEQAKPLAQTPNTQSQTETHIGVSPSQVASPNATTVASTEKDYDEFEVGEHQVPWFLWVFFLLIVSWASISWIKFFNY